MRNYENETRNRIAFIQNLLKDANADGIIYGNSGGKDSALVGILCKMACDNTAGLIMPCSSKRNYELDKVDAEAIAEQFHIHVRSVDLTDVKNALVHHVGAVTTLTDNALANIAPRLRMTTLYALAASENRLVAGTGNRSEGYMGYFTKWGDGAFDFNPIADLTVTEIYEFLRYLGAPDFIITKAPSAGLYDGQTDENEMGITYRNIDEYLLRDTASENDQSIIKKCHEATKHKRSLPMSYGMK